MTPHPRSASTRLSLLALLTAPTVLLAACGDEIHNDHHHYYYGEAGADDGQAGAAGEPGGQGGEPHGQGGGGGEMAGAGPEAGAGGEAPEFPVDPRYPDAPLTDTHVKDQSLDPFGVVGNRYYFGVTDVERDGMNNDQGGGNPNGDPYSPGGPGLAHFVDHLWITTGGEDPQTADYGKVQVKVVGQSSRRAWDAANIPNLNIDADQFVKDQRIGGFEHLRFDNGQVGSIFRERLTLELYRKLGYPAPLSTYAWVESNVWGPEVSIPYILVERYKRAFCERYKDEFGGGCLNMWEFWGDFNQYNGRPKMGAAEIDPIPQEPGGGQSVFDDPSSCQIDECENTRVKQLEAKLLETEAADGFKAALAEYIDWPSFHRFQCLSYVLGTGDDTLHNNNNVVLVERADGLFQYLPYSVDISLGQDWYQYTPLPGDNMIANGCQHDKTCWDDTMTECAVVIEEFAALKPNELLEAVYDELDAHGMLRAGDEGRYQVLDAWFSDRLAKLPTELETFRDPYAGPSCKPPMIDCNGYCVYPEACQVCIPPDKPEPLPGPMMGAGGAGPDDGGGAGGDMAAGGGGPIICPPKEEYPMIPMMMAP
jgi:hypothetical protein